MMNGNHSQIKMSTVLFTDMNITLMPIIAKNVTLCEL